MFIIYGSFPFIFINMEQYNISLSVIYGISLDSIEIKC